MKTYKIISLLTVILLISCNTLKHSQSTLLSEGKKVILKEKGQAEFSYWELENKKSLWQSVSVQTSHIQEYRDSLKVVMGAVEYNKAVEDESVQNLSRELIQNEKNGDKINALLVHTGSIGKIRDMNNLEAQVLNYQLSRFPLLSHPTEFHGFIAVNEKENKVRIYFAASDQQWPPKPTVIIEAVEEIMKSGWRLKYHLHNHYGSKENNYVGVLAPSLADAQYFKMLSERFSIQAALITNGFRTVEIKASNFEKFESH